MRQIICDNMEEEEIQTCAQMGKQKVVTDSAPFENEAKSYSCNYICRALGAMSRAACTKNFDITSRPLCTVA